MDIPIPDSWKEKGEEAYSSFRARYSSLYSYFVKKFPLPLARDEKGIFGLSGLMTVMALLGLFAVALLMAQFLDNIIKSIASNINLTALLIHIPQIDVGGMSFATQWPSGGLPPVVQAASHSAGSLYSTFQTISIVVIILGFMIVGLSRLLEEFNVMNPGTSEKILSESVLILILIFIFPYFFNAGAAALNATNERVILSPSVPENAAGAPKPTGADVKPKDVTGDIAAAAGTVPAITGDVGGVLPFSIPSGADPTRAIVMMVTMTASFMAVMIAFTTGLFKIVATAALAAAFPLILSLRLIPFLRDVSNKLTSSLIGLMLASLVIALFFRVGWEMLMMTWGDTTMRWAIGVALLMSASGAFTITAPALSGMSSEISGTMGRSTAGAIGGMVATGATGAMGAGAGAGAGMAKGYAGGGKMGAMKGAAGGFGKGLKRGAPGKDLVGSVSRGAGGGKEAGLEAVAGESKMGGQSKENLAATKQNLRGHAKDVKNADEGTVSHEAKEGKEFAESIDGLSDGEAMRHLRRASDKGEMSDTELEALQEKSDLTGKESREVLKRDVAHVKDSKNLSEKEGYATLWRAVKKGE